MGPAILSEKKTIELATTSAFLIFYNHNMGTSYKVESHSENPDFICFDSDGNKLQIDVTLTESFKEDIKARLGRSEHKNVNNMKVSNISLQDSTIESVTKCICKKLLKRYGPNTALVVRDTCPLDLSWELFKNEIKEKLKNEFSPYDKGIWIIPDSMNRIIRVL
jgi:hypothetical protein